MSLSGLGSWERVVSIYALAPDPTNEINSVCVYRGGGGWGDWFYHLPKQNLITRFMASF